MILWLAVIMYYDTGLINSQKRPWNELYFALCATFHSYLHPHLLERRPKNGPHVFTELQLKWLAGASREALDVLDVVAPSHRMRSLHLRLRRRFHGPCGMPEVAEVPPRGKAAPIMWGRIPGSRTRN